jgi:hypothetical protein
MINRIASAILLLPLACALSFGQKAFKGLQPGRATRSDVERMLGSSIRRVSETLSEYKSDNQTEMIFVQYRSNSDVIERIELVYLETLFRPDVIRKLKVPADPTTSQIKKNRLEEYYGSPWFVVLTYGVGPEALRVSRIGYYSRELFESATEKLPKDQPRYKVPDPPAPPLPSIGNNSGTSAVKNGQVRGGLER